MQPWQRRTVLRHHAAGPRCSDRLLARDAVRSLLAGFCCLQLPLRYLIVSLRIACTPCCCVRRPNAAVHQQLRPFSKLYQLTSALQELVEMAVVCVTLHLDSKSTVNCPVAETCTPCFLILHTPSCAAQAAS
jgi:hypothetical protein